MAWGPVGRELFDGLGVVASALEEAVTAPTWPLSDATVGGVLTALGRLRAAAERVEVAVIAEAVERGLPTAQGWGAQDWVARCEGGQAPAPSAAHVAQVCRLAAASARHRGAGCGPDREPGTVAAAFAAGALSLAKADLLARFEEEVARVAAPEEVAADLAVLTGSAPALTERELATAARYAARLLKPARDLDREEDARGAPGPVADHAPRTGRAGRVHPAARPRGGRGRRRGRGGPVCSRPGPGG